ncbi:MAG TPA: L,D-transpeptidase family protein [Syntrophorhabdaceae bacterium]|nr:L,D-transpeptidase family protein [Syntrophorhabdaceae bacterium]
MKTLCRTIWLFFFFVSPLTGFAADMLIGEQKTHVVQKDETLLSVGAQYGVFWKTIARENGITADQPLVPGSILKINTRRIVPKLVGNGIVINIPDRSLYFFKDGQVTFFPVGLGVLTKTNTSDWRTPTGNFYVTSKRKNPTWHVPDSIQLENFIKGKSVEERVPPGPKNPLGKYAIETSIPATLIHETIWPNSVYRYTSHGCIRMLPKHMEQFYNMVDVKTKGEIIYEPVKLAVLDGGKIYLEVRTDVYGKYQSLRERIIELAYSRDVSDRVDWQKVDRLIKLEAGVAEDVTTSPKTAVNQPHKESVAEKFLGYLKSRFKDWI